MVLDVYAAREDPEPGVTGRLVADAVPGGAHYVADFADVPKAVAALAAPGDLVLTMGAGDITRMGPLVLAEIAAGSGRQDRAPMSEAPPPAPSGTASAAEPGGRAPGGPLPGGPPVPGGPLPGRRRRPRSRWRAAFFVLAGLAIVAGSGWALLGNRRARRAVGHGHREPTCSRPGR